MKADIDIDTPTSVSAGNIFHWVRASIVKNAELSPHPCGYYPQNMPADPVTGLAAIPYETAEELGWSKVDFLHLSVYDHFSSREEIEQLLEVEPDWGLLLVPSEQAKLFQLAKHGDILSKVKPRSVLELADVLALIRPGKRDLLKLYTANPSATRSLLYARDESGYSFKKSHSIAYAHVIVLQLHLIAAGLI